MEIKQPKYKIGDIVLVHSEEDKQLVLQGIIKSAQYAGEWFYEIFAHNPTDVEGENDTMYSFENDCGDAKTKIVS